MPRASTKAKAGPTDAEVAEAVATLTAEMETPEFAAAALDLQPGTDKIVIGDHPDAGMRVTVRGVRRNGKGNIEIDATDPSTGGARVFGAADLAAPGSKEAAMAATVKARVKRTASSATTKVRAPKEPTQNKSGSTHLSPGSLGDLVLAALKKATEPQGPSQIAKTIDRSAGAIANALDRMTAAGTTTLVSAKPKRYALAESTPKVAAKKAATKKAAAPKTATRKTSTRAAKVAS